MAKPSSLSSDEGLRQQPLCVKSPNNFWDLFVELNPALSLARFKNDTKGGGYVYVLKSPTSDSTQVYWLTSHFLGICYCSYLWYLRAKRVTLIFPMRFDWFFASKIEGQFLSFLYTFTVWLDVYICLKFSRTLRAFFCYEESHVWFVENAFIFFEGSRRTRAVTQKK